MNEVEFEFELGEHPGEVVVVVDGFYFRYFVISGGHNGLVLLSLSLGV